MRVVMRWMACLLSLLAVLARPEVARACGGCFAPPAPTPDRAQVVTDQDLIGKINVTGLALPSEFKQFIDNGASQAVALWNPIDLGYSAVMLANALVEGEEAAPGATFSIGRVGEVTLDDTNAAAMAVPFQFDKSNIEEFSKIY